MPKRRTFDVDTEYKQLQNKAKKARMALKTQKTTNGRAWKDNEKIERTTECENEIFKFETYVTILKEAKQNESREIVCMEAEDVLSRRFEYAFKHYDTDENCCHPRMEAEDRLGHVMQAEQQRKEARQQVVNRNEGVKRVYENVPMGCVRGKTFWKGVWTENDIRNIDNNLWCICGYPTNRILRGQNMMAHQRGCDMYQNVKLASALEIADS